MNKRFIKLWQQLKDLQEMGHEVDDYDKYLIGVLEQLRENWPDGDEDKLADQLGVTTLHYLHIKAISEIEISRLRYLLELTHELDVLYAYSLLPIEKVEDYTNSPRERARAPHKILKRLYQIFNRLSADEREQSASSEVVLRFKNNIENTHWAALAEDSKGWARFREADVTRIKRFSRTTLRHSIEDWEWLIEVCRKYFSEGVINSENGDHHKAITENLSE